MPQIRYAISVPEAARRIGISKPHMYILARRDDFPSFSIGNRVLVYEDAFLEWVKTQARNHAHIPIGDDEAQ